MCKATLSLNLIRFRPAACKGGHQQRDVGQRRVTDGTEVGQTNYRRLRAMFNAHPQNRQPATLRKLSAFSLRSHLYFESSISQFLRFLLYI